MQPATLATATLFGGAGLIVNNDRGAFGLPEFPLKSIQIIAVLDRDTCLQNHAVVLLKAIGHHHDPGCALGHTAFYNLRHRQALGPLAHLLTACHGDCIVIKNLESDIDARCDALTNRKNPTMKPCAISEIGKDMFFMSKRCLADPGHALASHLGKGAGGSVHPDRHVVAANTC